MMKRIGPAAGLFAALVISSGCDSDRAPTADPWKHKPTSEAPARPDNGAQVPPAPRETVPPSAAASDPDRPDRQPVSGSTNSTATSVDTDVRSVGAKVKGSVERAGDKLENGVHRASEKIKKAGHDVKEDLTK